ALQIDGFGATRDRRPGRAPEVDRSRAGRPVQPSSPSDLRGADPPTDLEQRAGFRATGAPPSCIPGRAKAPLVVPGVTAGRPRPRLPKILSSGLGADGRPASAGHDES